MLVNNVLTKTVFLVVQMLVFVILLVAILDWFSQVKQKNVYHAPLDVKVAKLLIFQTVKESIQDIMSWLRMENQELKDVLQTVINVQVQQYVSNALQALLPQLMVHNACSNAVTLVIHAPPTILTIVHHAIQEQILIQPQEYANPI